MELLIGDFPVPALINHVTSMVAPLISKNNNELVIKIASDVGWLRSDETKLRQTLFNLLSNASKFTDNGIINLDVYKETTAEEAGIVFKITDTGIGIDPNELQLLFKDFSQIDSSTTRKYGGTGLGLAISKRFCQLMGGDLSVVSEAGKGSIFTAVIPISRAHKTVQSDLHTEMKDLYPVEWEDGAEHNLVLVIDDDPSVHDLIRRTLQVEGFGVIGAMDGHKGLKLARTLHPCAIILDVMMPEIDGWTVLGQLKSDPETSDIPVLVLSIVDDPKLGFTLGASDYLVKPANREILVSLLKKHACDIGNCRILLIEDDEMTRDSVRRMLIDAGYLVVTAVNGKEALQILKHEKPGLILLDLMMPEMDGFEFLEIIKTNAELENVPIIVATARELTGDERDRLNTRAFQVLQKGSYGREELLQQISKGLSNLKKQVAHDQPNPLNDGNQP